MGNEGVSGSYDPVSSDDGDFPMSTESVPPRRHWTRMHRSVYGECESGPCNDCPHYSPPNEGQYRRQVTSGRPRRRLSVPLEGITVFGGDLTGSQLVVNHSRFSCGCVTDRILPVLHVQPMLRVLSPVSCRSPSPRPHSSLSVSSRGSRSSGHSSQTVYPQYIPHLL